MNFWKKTLSTILAGAMAVSLFAGINLNVIATGGDPVGYAGVSTGNLALGKTVTANTNASAAAGVTDGVITDASGNSWAKAPNAAVGDEWLDIDLGSDHAFNKVVIYWGTAPASYSIGVWAALNDSLATANQNFNARVVGSQKTNKPVDDITTVQGVNDAGSSVMITTETFDTVIAKRLRLFMAPAAGDGSYPLAVQEIEVFYDSSLEEGTNLNFPLGQGGVAVSYNSSEPYNKHHSMPRVFDGIKLEQNNDNYWQTKNAGDSWISVNYDKVYSVGKIVMSWKDNFKTSTDVNVYAYDDANHVWGTEPVAQYTLTDASDKNSVKDITFSSPIATSGFKIVTTKQPELVEFEAYIYEAPTVSNCVKVLGRALQETKGGEEGYTFTYGGSGIEVNFIGSELSMYVSDFSDWSNGVNFMIDVDTDMPMEASKITATERGWVTVVSGLEDIQHTVTIRKMSRGFGGIMASEYVSISDVKTDGMLLPASPKSDLVIEVYGDSITNGDATWLETNGSNSAYTAASYSTVVGRLLGADTRVVGNTGNGLCGWVMAGEKNGNVDNLLPPQNSWSVFDPNYNSAAYSHAGDNAADVVIINLGTNDRIELSNNDLTRKQFSETYFNFIKQIKTDCPDAIVICTLGAMSGNEWGTVIGPNGSEDGFDYAEYTWQDGDYTRTIAEEGKLDELIDAGSVDERDVVHVHSVVKQVNDWYGSEFCYWSPIVQCSTINGGLGYDHGHPSNVAHEIYGLQFATLINEKLSLGIDLPDINNYIVGNPNLAFEADATYTCSSNYDGKLASQAFDNDENTKWQAEDNMYSDAWVQISFAEARTVGYAKITWQDINAEGTGVLQYSVDGTIWVDLIGGLGETSNTSDVRSFEPVTAKYFRLLVGSTSDRSNNGDRKHSADVEEIELYDHDPAEDTGALFTVSKTVARQSSDGTGNILRLIAAVNATDFKPNERCPQFREIGFDITVEDDEHGGSNTRTYGDYWVFDEIGGVDAADLDVEGGKVFIFTVLNVPQDCTLTVKAYAIDKNGTKIYGYENNPTIIKMAGGMLTVRN